jgi:hypothetical protein
MLMVVMVLMDVPMSVVMISHNVPFLVSLPRSYIAFPATWLQSGGETIMESHSERIGLQETRHYLHRIAAT